MVIAAFNVNASPGLFWVRRRDYHSRVRQVMEYVTNRQYGARLRLQTRRCCFNARDKEAGHHCHQTVYWCTINRSNVSKSLGRQRTSSSLLLAPYMLKILLKVRRGSALAWLECPIPGTLMHLGVCRPRQILQFASTRTVLPVVRRRQAQHIFQNKTMLCF